MKKKEKSSQTPLDSIIKNSLGEKLVLPENLSIYKPFSDCIYDSTEIANSEIKLYSHINASCSTCVINIKKWDSVASVYRKFNVPIILICESDDKFELIKYYCESGEIRHFSYPLFFDEKNEFLSLNKFMKATIHFETILTDKDNNILMMGNPLFSKDMADLYLEKIIENQSPN